MKTIEPSRFVHTLDSRSCYNPAADPEFMYISTFQLVNYKSYRNSPELLFTPGFNIISGQNNAGKTALLEAMSLDFEAKPHRSLQTVPFRGADVHPASTAIVSFTLSNEELRELLSPRQEWMLLKPNPVSEYARAIGCNDDSAGAAERLTRDFLSRDLFTFKLNFEAQLGRPMQVATARVPSYGLYDAQSVGGSYRACSFSLQRDGAISIPHAQQLSNKSDLGSQLSATLAQHVYRFAAERMNVGKSGHGPGTVLERGARNLPEVLSQLQHNVARFRELNQRLSEILPQVRWVSVRGLPAGQVEIVVWCHDPETRRDDLAVPLLESGTGIAQVLAILYVVMTSERPQVVIIDEPQSFLHPGASRKLIDFLRGYPQHQFIIATHSADVISATNPTTITLTRFEGGQSIIRQIDAETEHGVRAILEDLGVRLSDLFGADNILWVEGRTEEKCFPIIVEKMLRRKLMGTQILGIRETGDLEGRDARRVFQIYRRLADGASLLPPAMAFILDEECRSNEIKEELRRLSGGLARFLRRRMFENYLLNCEAIAAVTNGIENFREQPITAEEIRNTIQPRMANPTYYCSRRVPESEQDRLASVDAARILCECFSELSEARVTYAKVPHGQLLTNWLVENVPDDLAEVSDVLRHVLDRN